MAEWSLIENIQRVDLNAIEVAKSYEQLIRDYGYTHDDLSKNVGKSRSAITNSLRLLKLPEQVQSWIMEGKLSQSAARSLLSPDIADPESVARDIIEKGMNVRQVENLAKEKNKRKRQLPKPLKSRSIRILSNFSEKWKSFWEPA